ncbi:hypothetical protein, partial [Xanthovirga aplysinae]|uniref:hypothetical protein n=1 Tax=Xanthovirga aplysinae TaxID=2529853 RepID=UPI00165732E3
TRLAPTRKGLIDLNLDDFTIGLLIPNMEDVNARKNFIFGLKLHFNRWLSSPPIYIQEYLPPTHAVDVSKSCKRLIEKEGAHLVIAVGNVVRRSEAFNLKKSTEENFNAESPQLFTLFKRNYDATKDQSIFPINTVKPSLQKLDFAFLGFQTAFLVTTMIKVKENCCIDLNEARNRARTLQETINSPAALAELYKSTLKSNKKVSSTKENVPLLSNEKSLAESIFEIYENKMQTFIYF